MSSSPVRRPRPRLAVWLDLALRKLMWHTLSNILPLYLVVEYPKSGGTWLGQMLADYLHIPFPRNRLPVLRASVMHGHHLYSPHFRNVFCVLRDGRDAIVSAYYHLLFHNERNDPRLVERVRRDVGFRDYDNVRANLPAFIEYMFERYDRRPLHFTWTQFVQSWLSQPVCVVRYEALVADTAAEFKRALSRVLRVEPDRQRLEQIVERYSFERQAGRRPGQENPRSFLRKGVPGDWKNKFSPEARRVFHRYAGEALIAAGYEADDRWVKAVAS